MTPEQLQHTTDVVARALRLIDLQQAEIAKLKERNAAMEISASFLQRYAQAVLVHNLKCEAECDKGFSCGYEGFLKRTGRRCASCPALFKIDPMPHEGVA